MLVWNPEGADDAVWAGLREHFSEEQIKKITSHLTLQGGRIVHAAGRFAGLS